MPHSPRSGAAVVVILDTSVVPDEERSERVRVAMAETSASSVALLGGGHPVSARLDVWQLGGSYLFRAATSPVRMSRSEKQARRDPVPLLALAVQERGEGLHRQFAPLDRVHPGMLMGMDMTEPFEFSWSGQGASRALMMPLDQLDVPAGLLRRALPQLARSPLYDLVTSHIVELFDAADALTAHPSAARVADSSVDLARALIASLSPDASARRDAAAQTLWVRIREYVRQNLRDPGLDATAVAAAHNISLRKLYNVCAALDISLEQMIIRRRLEGVRAELALPAARDRSIESIARAWGFRNVSHFTRRFGQEFGLSPREWRTLRTPAPKQRPDTPAR
ncbi:helix-turn-helix domain-containing protein [Actinospica durhamensis]|uniref:Helix-turn-helix domain-containing protein n=1 Tax=Actinospica durhamensis TaxID=1508375 RepID=A0A941EW93_9ACTN|nr:helix-turn-helix domain-containing protein [Actinospica durhamensis]MBR7838426.1 helix-turn-helix domain-containing protein [Actinospica durhamensis]